MPTFVGRDEGWLKALPQAFGYGFLYLFTCCCFSDKSDIGMGSEPGASPISPPAAVLNDSSATTLDSPDMSLSRLTATDRSGRTLELSASASHGNSGPPSRATSIGVPEDYVSNADSIDDILLYKQNADLTIDDVDERQISYPSGASATDELPLAPLDPSLQSAAAPLQTCGAIAQNFCRSCASSAARARRSRARFARVGQQNCIEIAPKSRSFHAKIAPTQRCRRSN